MKKTSVTVLMSVYNGERYLKQSVNSILKQTFRDFEFLIINDASSDRTSEILNRFNDPRIRIINNDKNLGLTKSLNIALTKSRGKYIARMDADDFSLPQRLEKQFNFLENNSDYGMVGCFIYRIVDDHIIKNSDDVYFTDHDDIVATLMIDNYYVHSAVMYRKECINNLGGYNEDLKFAQDYDLWLRIAEKYKIANLGEFLHCWRDEKSGISHKMRDEQKKYAYIIRDTFIKKNIGSVEWQDIMQVAYARSHDVLIGKYLKEIAYKKISDRSARDVKKDIKIIAIISAYNEEDIIVHTVRNMIENDIEVYFIDHHSTDKTVALIEEFLGKGIRKIELFPEDSNYPLDLKETYAWRYILKRKEELHSLLGADWYMHMDADAMIQSPWNGVTVSEAIKLVDALGYNCVNFELFNFRPTNAHYDCQMNPQDSFNYWEPDNYDEPQIKCWKNFGQKIDLVSSGGHIVEFTGQKVFPIKFIMKHYPIRSKAHGLKKVFVDRLPRYDKKERNMFWHTQYDRYFAEDINFDKKNLLDFNGNDVRQIYLPLISCLSILDDKKRIIADCDRRIEEIRSQITSVYHSRTWKIGRMATFPWRLLLDFFKKIRLNSKN